MDEVEPIKDFYDSEVQQYDAVEAYAGPFDTGYYMGSGFDRTAAETLETDILHADKDSVAVNYLERNGYKAVETDVTTYNPEEVFDLIIISHLPTFRNPLVKENISSNGTVICRTDSKAQELNEISSLNLQAVYEESQMLVEKEKFDNSKDFGLYVFQ